jgi:hypothetical protein
VQAYLEGAAADYREAMIILRQQEEYTEDDLEMFQMKIDNFFYRLCRAFRCWQRRNYTIHMLGSSHIKYFMKQHRNLQKFPQQGWESWNEKFKTSVNFLFRFLFISIMGIM